MDDSKLISALNAIDPASVDYRTWVNIGMALKHDGYPPEMWEQWSAQDSARYHQGECARKWLSFTEHANPVTVATIYATARDFGWTPARGDIPLSWTDAIENDTAPAEHLKPVPPAREKTDKPASHKAEPPLTAETAEAILQPLTDPALAKLSPAEQLKLYFETLFKREEHVGYVTGDVFQDDDGKWKPKRGVIHRTVGEILADLERYPDKLANAIGDWEPAAGAWVRFNPLDGEGAKNKNVTRLTYALVESDDMPLAEQAKLLEDLRVPVACLVYSGGKSLHAIVHVDAANTQEYSERVEKLYAILKKNGMTVDEQNCNPSRLSRLPGVTRNGIPQRLLAVNQGCRSWDEWLSYMEIQDDGLPAWVPLNHCINDPPVPAPELIHGVLRMGHKMLLSGGSKIGKSYLLMELAVDIVEGRKWLGFACTRGRVLYVNLEIDPNSCLLRFLKIYEALGIPMAHANDLVVWNLRGKAMPLDQLVPKIIRRCRGENFTAVFIDPIYKVETGDENSASDMGAFCNQFDALCQGTGAAAIYCHHHSKGAQGSKRAIDRASGSGVFSRDPDAQLDIIQLELSEALINTLGDRQATAWRMEGILREFPSFEPVNFWYHYPLHIVDKVHLNDLPAEGSMEAGRLRARKENSMDRRASLEMAYSVCSIDGQVTLDAMAKYLSMSVRGLRDRLKQEEDSFYVMKGYVFRRESDEADEIITT